ncbi:MAG: divalent-cation tolerance protein CutA [Deltaproteobacteria bacterium]|nr:divalent-cation tolerance protein CutA [Deltaproteobacteria bacterium]
MATFPDDAVADRIARVLVEEALVACVNLLPPVRSIYRWKGAVETAPEVLVMMKTRSSNVDVVAARLKALHPYEVPELIALPVVAGLPAYLQWVMGETLQGNMREPTP